MDITERIRELCRKNGTSVTKLEKALGYGNGSITKDSTKSLKCDRAIAIARYFNVSVEYLLTGEDPAAGFGLSREEIEIIKAYRLKSDDAKDIIASALGVKRQDTSLLVSSKAG